MLTDKPKIKELMYENAAQQFATLQGITLEESKLAMSTMSFIQYCKLLEAGANISPPSGQTIGPAAGAPSMPGGTQPQQTQQQTQQQARQQKTQQSPQKTQVMWGGQGTPIEQGMTVGLKDVSGKQVPGEITQVDQSANGVKVRNPTTGQEEWHGNDDLEQFQDTNTPGSQPQQNQQMAEEIKRMRQLAGIAEDASGGASCAGAMGAGTPQPLGGKMKRRQVEETPAVEYKQGPQKTVVGDTKPNQASGKLSADLAARGKKTASRINNGMKR